MSRRDAEVLVAAVCASFTAAIVLLACGAAVPSTSDQAAVATYAADLEGCIVTAKFNDAGMPGYLDCRAKINALFNVPGYDAGAGVSP